MSQLAALFKKPIPKYRSKNGVTRIVRDSYGKPSNWFSMTTKVKERDRYCCVYCSKKEEPKNDVWHDVHHLKELSRGGKTTMSNLVTICKVCHAKRHTHLNKAGYTTGTKAR